jgi:NAD(P)-dependent dehydrogenase (short-subunit alcohol dehydrogenase family)
MYSVDTPDSTASSSRRSPGVLRRGVRGSPAASGRTRSRQARRLRGVFDVNVLGVVRVTRAFLPLLEASVSPVIVNVGSALGSGAIVTDPARMESGLPALASASSKAAVIMLTVQYAKALGRIRVNVVEPGFTATDLNGNRGHQTVAAGAEIIVRMATIGPDGPTGTFQDRTGTMPW